MTVSKQQCTFDDHLWRPIASHIHAQITTPVITVAHLIKAMPFPETPLSGESSDDPLLSDYVHEQIDSGNMKHTSAIGRVKLGLVLGVCLLLSIGPITVLYERRGAGFGDCGANPQEARSKGCLFDNIGYAWVQPACYNADLVKEFSAMDGVEYYINSDMTDASRIPQEVISEGNITDAYAPFKFHAIHCAQAISKVHWAAVNRAPVDSKSLSFEHTEHCQHVLLGTVAECQETNHCQFSKLTARYTTCDYLP